MNVKKFKKKVKNWHKPQFSDKAYGGLPWEDWYKLADMTNEVDYKCSFRGDGSCVQLRNRKERGSSPSEMCCCIRCAYDIGYLRFIQDDPAVIEEIASHFQLKIGFWRKGKGCILPRKYRSATCLGYRCYDSGKTDVDSKDGVLVALMNSIRAGSITDRKLHALGKALTSSG